MGEGEAHLAPGSWEARGRHAECNTRIYRLRIIFVFYLV